ncbi:MAG: alkaline phosphatase family protein [Lactimicrobium sp.]|jgi:hypothetical protein|uniref:alkaline phosphatase family protein n=1 Tax=Lactimicrobium sp. TaxID=2563780 RepID=UPI002F35FCE8
MEEYITDYKTGLLQISSALFHYYGLSCEYEQDKDVSAWLTSHAFRCVIVVLVDGMGSRILQKYGSDLAITKQMKKECMTVFPPTTSAATTSLLTGKSPAENGWLGWNQYFRELDDNVILFLDKSQYSSRKYHGFVQKTLPVTTILDRLKEKNIPCDSIWPSFGHNPCASLHEQCQLAAKLSHQPDLRFLYVYWDGFDSWLHEHGPSHPDTHRQLAMINEDILMLEKMVDEDTGVLVLADHGQVDCTIYELQKDEELMAMFRHMPALEARACAFYLKPGLEDAFVHLFHERFGDKFLLLSKDEILSREIFGPGIPHPRLSEFIGDYLAIARTPLCLTAKTSHFHGQHAGAMVDEVMIPVILSGESV